MPRHSTILCSKNSEVVARHTRPASLGISEVVFGILLTAVAVQFYVSYPVSLSLRMLLTDFTLVARSSRVACSAI